MSPVDLELKAQLRKFSLKEIFFRSKILASKSTSRKNVCMKSREEEEERRAGRLSSQLPQYVMAASLF